MWYVLGNEDSASRLRVGGLIQFDGRTYFDDTTPTTLTDTFLIRRARPILAGTFANLVDAFLMPDFAGGTLTLYDAYVDLHPWSWLSVRGGKFKTPFGLERLQDDRDLIFLERGLTADIDPDRDIGVTVHGNFGIVSRQANAEHPSIEDQIVFHYDLAALNGATDGASDNSATQNAKTLVARVFAQPFLATGLVALKGVGLGVAGTYGRVQGNASSSDVPTFVTPAQNTFFSYLPNVVANGDRTRLTPEVFYHVGSFAFLGEYVMSLTNVTTWVKSAQLEDEAWQAQASFILTGEEAYFTGVVPTRPFSVAQHNYGAFQIAARYSELLIDPSSFPTFANPALSANRATNFAGDLNWYFTYNFRFGVEFDWTNFDGGAPDNGNRASEKSLIGRMQAAF
jgi:phosphate-selective porin OprO/OprP